MGGGGPIPTEAPTVNDLQRAARTRKLVYLGLIVALFTLSMFWRGKVPVGDATASEPTVMDRLARLTVEGQANDLELSELDLGDPEIAGSAFRVGLVGFRGVVVTYLWSSAIEKQRRNEWHDFELYARTVTRLQPNFITPWLYQGWNISYNVSVENDKLGDMFFFIARGIELLSEGDRLNTKRVRRPGMEKEFFVGSPDLRRDVAFFYQNKFTVSDKVTTLRCLMQLAAIPPEARSPTRLRPKSGEPVDDKRFREFCEENPQLVRRLVTPQLNVTLTKAEGVPVFDTIAATPDQIADFLAANIELPTRWEKNGRLKADDAQFPTLPPAFAENAEYHPGHPDLKDRYDRYDALLAARAWFQYAQEVVPPPPKDSRGVAIAAAAPKRPSDYNPNDPNAEYKYRMPQYPALIVFRYYPARSQSYLAERLQKEGWYDGETVWNPDDGKLAGQRWYKDGQPPLLLKAKDDSLAQWEEAKRRWEAFGRGNGLEPSAEDKRAMAEAYRKTQALFPTGQLPLDLPPELADLGITADDLKLRKAYEYLPQNLHVTNYERFRDESQAEATREMVAARKELMAAENLRLAGKQNAAIVRYAAAIAQWRRALDGPNTQQYFRGDRSDSVHEFSFGLEQKLTDLYKQEPVILRQAEEQTVPTHPAFQAPLPAVSLLALPPEQPQPADLFGFLAPIRKDKYVLQDVAEEKALTEIAVQLRVQTGVPEAVARAEVAEGGKFAYLKRYVDRDGGLRWVRRDARESKLKDMNLLRPPPDSLFPSAPPPLPGDPPRQMPAPNAGN